MPKKRFSAEQVVTLLRRIRGVDSARQVCTGSVSGSRDIAARASTTRRKGYGGLEIDQARRMKDLERENVRLKHT